MAYNFLIVDDSSVARSVLSKTVLMSYPDTKIFQAVNGLEALEVLKKEWIDIVFADINMPVMNGMELIDKMSADGLTDSIPVIIVSTEGSSTRLDELKHKGIRGYIRKPFTPEALSKVVANALEISK